MLKLSLSGEKTGEISCFPCCHGHDDNAATKAWLAACRCEYTGRYALLLSTLSALCSPMREAALMTHQCGAVHCPSVLKCHQCQMQGMCRSPLMLTRITFIIGRFFKYLSLYIYNGILHADCLWSTLPQNLPMWQIPVTWCAWYSLVD